MPRSRALSQAQVAYAAGIAEATGSPKRHRCSAWAAQQRKRMDGLIEQRATLFSPAGDRRLVPSVFQSLIYLLLVAALALLHAAGRATPPRSGRSSCSSSRRLERPAGQAAYQGLSQSLPFIERTQEPSGRYLASAPRRKAHLPLRSADARLRARLLRLPAGQPRSPTSASRCAQRSDRHHRPVGRRQVHADPAAAAAARTERAATWSTACPAQDFRRDDWHRRVAYVPQEPRLIHASVAENIRYFRDIDRRADRAGRRGWRTSTTTIMSWDKRLRDGRRAPRRRRLRRPAAAHLPGAGAGSAAEVLVLDEPTSALDPHSETLIQESLTALKQRPDDCSSSPTACRRSTSATG